jgi:hypothetical protein
LAALGRLFQTGDGGTIRKEVENRKEVEKGVNQRFAPCSSATPGVLPVTPSCVPRGVPASSSGLDDDRDPRRRMVTVRAQCVTVCVAYAAVLLLQRRWSATVVLMTKGGG